MAKGLGLSMDQIYTNVDRYGNTSAASVPSRWPRRSTRAASSVGDRITVVAFGAGLHLRRGDDRMDGRPGNAGASAERPSASRGRPRPAARRLGLGRPDPRRARRAHGPARAGRRAARRRRSREGPPTPDGRARRREPASQPLARWSRWRSTRDRSVGKSAVVTGGRAASAARSRCDSPTQGADVAFSYRGNEAAANETKAAIEALGRRAARGPGGRQRPRGRPRRSSRRRSRRSARSTSSSTTPASPATT